MSDGLIDKTDGDGHLCSAGIGHCPALLMVDIKHEVLSITAGTANAADCCREFFPAGSVSAGNVDKGARYAYLWRPVDADMQVCCFDIRGVSDKSDEIEFGHDDVIGRMAAIGRVLAGPRLRQGPRDTG